MFCTWPSVQKNGDEKGGKQPTAFVGYSSTTVTCLSSSVVSSARRGDFPGHLRREMHERKEFFYPPFSRLIHITLQHKDDKVAYLAADFFANTLRHSMGKRVLGPVQPHVPRVRNYYGQEILLKLEKSAPVLHAAKALILKTADAVTAKPGWGQVRVAVDVDPV